MLQKVKAVFQLMRWFHQVAVVLPFVGLYSVMAYYNLRAEHSCRPHILDVAVLGFCVQLLIAAGCVLNDLMDKNIDKVNKPHTHVVDRLISGRQAWFLFAVLSTLAALVSVYIARNLFADWAWISAAVYLSSLVYSVYLKRAPLFGNLTIAALSAGICLTIYFFAKPCTTEVQDGRVLLLVKIYSVFSFLIVLARELSLDISDMAGDKADGCKTLPIVIGAQKSKVLVASFICATIALSALTSVQHPYLWPVCWLVNLLLGIYLLRLSRASARIDYIRAGRFLWAVMLLGLAGSTVLTLLEAP